MHPANFRAIHLSLIGERLVFPHEFNSSWYAVTVPLELTDPDLFHDFFLIIQSDFKSSAEVTQFIINKGYLRTDSSRREWQDVDFPK